MFPVQLLGAATRNTDFDKVPDSPKKSEPLNAIAAMTRTGRVIGRGGRTPWHLPGELAWFAEATAGGCVLMGRRTFDSIGHALPGRINLVATRRPLPANEGVRTVELENFDPDEYEPRTVWVIGGAEIFAAMLPHCTAVYLSMIDGEVENGDTFMPAFEARFPLRETIRREAGFEVVQFLRQRGGDATT